MCRHYARPLLLIEFDADRQFGLQSASELGDDIDPKNVISKLTLLTLHFPKLRSASWRAPRRGVGDAGGRWLRSARVRPSATDPWVAVRERGLRRVDQDRPGDRALGPPPLPSPRG
jgi:hypothetical protein